VGEALMMSPMMLAWAVPDASAIATVSSPIVFDFMSFDFFAALVEFDAKLASVFNRHVKTWQNCRMHDPEQVGSRTAV
jgi:hypothetical protein